MERAPGVSVRRLGGLGDFASVSMRGSTPRQVEVLLDGVPLNPDGAGAVNLAELPLSAFSRVEVWRGNAPAELGSSAMGGVVNLVSGDAPAAATSATVGALHTLRLDASTSAGGTFAAVQVFSSDGAFRYLDDRATVYVPDDDRHGLRGNNDKGWVSAHVRQRWGDERLRLTLLSAATVREEGVPGPVGYPTPGVRYGVARDATVLQVDGGGDAVRGTARVWGLVRRERLDDRAGEIGVGERVRIDDTASLGLHGHGSWAPDGRLTLGATADARREVHVGAERLSGHADPSQARLAARSAVSATLRTANDRVALSPVLQGTWLDDRGTTADGRAHGAITPRVGLLVRPVDGLAFKANAGSYFRPPDLLELFGDRGVFVGRPDLRPERGRQADVGVRAAAERSTWRATAELTGSWSHARDLIVYVPNAQHRAVPVNLGESRVVGLEAAALLELGPLELSSNLTRSVSANLSPEPAYAGNQLPRVPGWELHHRTAVVLGPVRLGHTLDVLGADYRDATNWYRDAPRVLNALHARADVGSGVSVSVDVLNAADRIAQRVPRNPLDPRDDVRVLRPVTDFVGYPLPGRTALLTLRWSPR